MEYLADTVAVLRFLADTGKIGSKARKIFEETEKGEHIIWISIISIVEIMYLAEKNRIPVNLEDFIEKIKVNRNYKLIDLDLDIVRTANRLSGLELHDRLIVATAKYMDIPLITSDSIITNSGFIEILWDK
ncbi:MAG: PIN domain-containing protein [Candidatus Eremiobacterota bacterium]